MKIVSFNIGMKIDNSKEVARLLKEQDPDIICLQEVIRHLSDSAYHKFQSKAIIDKYLDRTYRYRFFGPQWISRAVYKHGKLHRDYGGLVEQGNYILSKYPIVEATNEHYFKHYSLEIDHTNFENIDHPRSVAIATLKIKGKKLTIFNLHGTYSTRKGDTPRSIAQAKYIVKRAKEFKNPLILIGDFNVTPDTKTMKIINREFDNIMNHFPVTQTLPYFKGKKDNKMIVDYVLTNKKVRAINFQVYRSNISDHLPLIFDFAIKQ